MVKFISLEEFGNYTELGTIRAHGKPYKVYDLPMMTDQRWNELAEKQAVKNYQNTFGRLPDSIDQAVSWQQERIERLIAQG